MSITKYSICEFTTPDTTFEEDLVLYAAAGATGIGVTEAKIVAGREREQAELLAASGLKATVCLPTNVGVLPILPELAYGGPQDTASRIAAMCGSIRRLALFDPDCIVVSTGSSEGLDAGAARRAAVEGLREAAAVASDVGTRLAVEPCRNDLGFDASFVQGIEAAVELILEIDRPNVGLCYDVYHHWHEDDIVSLTDKFAHLVVGVQVNDWREPPRSLADRLLPGDGVIDLPGLFAALDRGGYAGWYDLEVFSDDGRWGTELEGSIWKLPPEEIVRRGMAGMLDIAAKAERLNA